MTEEYLKEYKKMKRIIIALLLMICGIGVYGCGSSEEKQIIQGSCSENDYIWDGNLIKGLSDEGAKKKVLIIPKRCEGFEEKIFAARENTVKKVSFESDKDIPLGGVFSCTSSIEQVILPRELAMIGAFEFWNSSGIKTLTIPSNVLIIDEYAFKGMTSLQEIVFEGEITEIRDHAFEDCYMLKKIVLPDSVVVIGESAFSNCRALKKVILPTGLTEVGEYAFYGCDKLKKIVVPEEMTLSSYDATSIGQVKMFTIEKEVPTVRVVKDSWADQHFQDVFGKFKKKYQ